MLLAVGSVLAIYAALNLVLAELARRSERSLAAYPWPSEDYLRYMLPTLFERNGQDWTMITGPSEAREDLLHERLEAAFPGVPAYQGGMSLGTMDDLLLVLDYLEEAYGREALPRTLLLGITPRFVANISSIDESPLASSVDRYSPYFRVERTASGARLVPKTRGERVTSSLRFFSKHPSRYRAALCGATGRQMERFPFAGRSPWLAEPEEAPERISARGPLMLLRLCGSPYKYHHHRPFTEAMIQAWLRDTTSFWWKVHEWEPARDSAIIGSRLTRLLEVCRRKGIRLYIVNLPEHPLNRAGYRQGRYEAYLRIVRSAAGATPFLDLRDMLEADEFYDAGHARLRGAIAVTDTTIRFMRQARGRNASAAAVRPGGAGP